MTREYRLIGAMASPNEDIFYGYTMDRPVPVYECPECSMPVIQMDRHDQWHEQSKTVPCRCPRVGQPEPEYWFCSVHDRASYPKGPPVTSDTRPTVDGPFVW